MYQKNFLHVACFIKYVQNYSSSSNNNNNNNSKIIDFTRRLFLGRQFLPAADNLERFAECCRRLCIGKPPTRNGKTNLGWLWLASTVPRNPNFKKIQCKLVTNFCLVHISFFPYSNSSSKFIGRVGKKQRCGARISPWSQKPLTQTMFGAQEWLKNRATLPYRSASTQSGSKP